MAKPRHQWVPQHAGCSVGWCLVHRRWEAEDGSEVPPHNERALPRPEPTDEPQPNAAPASESDETSHECADAFCDCEA